MKKIIVLMGICATMMMFALTAFAKVEGENISLAQAQACTEENKTAWYGDFTKSRTTDPAKAYEAAKKYLGSCPTEDTDITKYLKKWVGLYDKEARKLQLQPLLYNDKKYAEAYTLGKEILADEPDNLRVLIDLGYGGYLAAATTKNEQFNADAINYATKAIQLIESGKAPESWAPFKSKEDALAYLYYTLGYLNRAKPATALAPFIKSAQFESELKKDPTIYYLIAVGYEGGLYSQLSADYKAKYEGKDETPESKLALENINQVIDRMIDAYARAVALAGNNPKHETAKKEWMESLTTWYKYRHNQSDVGLNEMLASIMSKPLPPVPTPLTSLPAAAPGGTSAVGTSAGSSTSTTTGATSPGATQNAAKPSGTPKSSSTTAPGRPRMR